MVQWIGRRSPKAEAAGSIPAREALHSARCHSGVGCRYPARAHNPRHASSSLVSATNPRTGKPAYKRGCLVVVTATRRSPPRAPARPTRWFAVTHLDLDYPSIAVRLGPVQECRWPDGARGEPVDESRQCGFREPVRELHETEATEPTFDYWSTMISVCLLAGFPCGRWPPPS